MVPPRVISPHVILVALLLLKICYFASAQIKDSDAATQHKNSNPKSFYCSCADPLPLALANGSATVPITPVTRTWYPGKPYKPSGFCKSLPTAGPGGECGDSIAICRKGLCCGQNGFCSTDPASCGGTCQCAWSGPGSPCKGSYPFPAPRPLSLPVAAKGGVCGTYIAVCPAGQCCSQFGFCVADGSRYCRSASCRADCSPWSKTCYKGAHKNKIVRDTWVVTWKDLNLDGFTKPVIVVNGKPFPTVEAEVGDRIIIKVINKIDDPISVHWHGMLQMKTNIMDGVTGLTQRPLMPGESYLYNFIADNSGTYWWHSHFKTQYVDGLFGALVVKDPTHKQYPGGDAVVLFNDYYHNKSSELLDYYLSPASDGDEPTPYTALLNGVGQGYCEVTGAAGCGYAYIKGVAGYCDDPKTKLRLINAGSFAVFNISIDNHRMIVMAEDGVEIEPVEVGSLSINNGQRYTVLVCQSNGKPLSTEPVWFRATMIDATFTQPSNWNTSLGVLYFTDPPPAKLPTTSATFLPPTLDPTLPPGPDNFNPYQLKVFGDVEPPPPNPAKRRRANFVIDFYNEPTSPADDPNAVQYAHVNKIALQLVPETPSLMERYSNNPMGLGPPAEPQWPQGGLGWHIWDINLGDVLDIYIHNKDDGEHPIHLHGHWFTVLHAGLPDAGPFDPAKDQLDATVIRDTITVNGNSSLVLRYVANNPGIWFMHCHIDWHVAAGLGMIFREGFPTN